MNAKLKISNMGCSACEKVIALMAKDIKGIKLSSISAKNGEAQVEAQSQEALDAFKAALKAEGYESKGCKYE